MMKAAMKKPKGLEVCFCTLLFYLSIFCLSGEMLINPIGKDKEEHRDRHYRRQGRPHPSRQAGPQRHANKKDEGSQEKQRRRHRRRSCCVRRRRRGFRCRWWCRDQEDPCLSNDRVGHQAMHVWSSTTNKGKSTYRVLFRAWSSGSSIKWFFLFGSQEKHEKQIQRYKLQNHRSMHQHSSQITFSHCSVPFFQELSIGFALPFLFMFLQVNAGSQIPSRYALFPFQQANLCSDNFLNSTLLLNGLSRLGVNSRVILHHTLQLVSSLIEQHLNISLRRSFEYA